MSAPIVDDVETGKSAADAGGATGDAAKSDAGTEALGDAGKQALDRMKAERKAALDRAKAAETELAELKKPKPVDGEAPDIQALIAAERDKFYAETLADKVRDKIEARAAKKFANPDDARLFLDGKVADFIDGKTVDTSAIDDALEALLKERPYLAVAQGDTKRFTGTGDGGPKDKAPGKPAQLSLKALDSMTPDAIEAARVAGQLVDIMAGKN